MKRPDAMEPIQDSTQRARLRDKIFHSIKVMRKADEMAPTPDSTLNPSIML